MSSLIRSASQAAAESDPVSELQGRLREFREARDWQQYHTPKNLAISIAIEAGELLEHFQWRSDDEIDECLRTDPTGIAQELADVAIYLVQLAEVTGIGLLEAIDSKIEWNNRRYPAEVVRGSNEKQP